MSFWPCRDKRSPSYALLKSCIFILNYELVYIERLELSTGPAVTNISKSLNLILYSNSYFKKMHINSDLRLWIKMRKVGDGGVWTDIRILWKRLCLTAKRIWLSKNIHYKNVFCYYKVTIEILQKKFFNGIRHYYRGNFLWQGRNQMFCTGLKDRRGMSLEIVFRHF